MTHIKVVGVIPARGGSKSIFNKNIIDLCGKPMIAWTIEESLKSKLDKVIVSTDSKRIKEISEKYGAEVPFLRPRMLSTDTSHTPDAIKFTLKNIEGIYDKVVTLQPTSPLRTYEHIDKAILESKGKDSLISITREEYPPFWLLEKIDDRVKLAFDRYIDPFNMERQEFPKLYRPNGAIYVTNVKYLMKNNSLINYSDCFYIEMDGESSMDIDTHIDYLTVKTYMEEKNVNNS